MKRLVAALMMLAAMWAGCLSLGGCVVAPPRAYVAVAPAQVWVPGCWGYGHVWVRGYWRYR